MPRNLTQFKEEREVWWGRFFDLDKIRSLRPNWEFDWDVVTDAAGASVTFLKDLTPAESAAKAAADGAKEGGKHARKQQQPPPGYRLEDFEQVHLACTHSCTQPAHIWLVGAMNRLCALLVEFGAAHHA